MCVPKTENIGENHLNEQQICKKCGLCCDGTLFGLVPLADEDRLHMESYFPDRIIQKNKCTFKQPCQYYKNKSCSIYNRWRPQKCSVFVCKLLIRCHEKLISPSEAIVLVEQAVAQAEQVRKRLSTNASDDEKALPKLFNEYVYSHPNPDQALMLEYGVLQCRLKRDFRKNDDTQNDDDAARAVKK